MKVKELIKALSERPQDAEVFFLPSDNDHRQRFCGVDMKKGAVGFAPYDSGRLVVMP